MKIMMLTAGSRGDVEPFVALAHAATARGHDVRLGVPDHSGAATTDLDVVSLNVDFAQLISDQGVAPVAAARAFRTVLRPAVQRMLTSAVEKTLAFSPDLVVYHPKILTAPHVAGSLGIPSVVVESVPSLTPTREFPAPGIVTADLGPFNPLTYKAVSLAAGMFRREIRTACRALPAAPPPPARGRASVLPISPQLLTRPRDWPADAHLTGYWDKVVPPGEPDPELEAFTAGGAYVYAGFGSMKAGDPEQRARVVINAARGQGLRVVVTTGWGGLEVPDTHCGEDVLVRQSVVHEHVLPRAVAALHHGGAGTVHAVARAGVPSVVVPFIADQPFWGRLLHRRGLAPEPIPFRHLTAARLGEALSFTESLRGHAREVGGNIRKENGLAVAVGVLEDLV